MNKKESTYAAAKADAQARADATGFDHSLEWQGGFGGWAVGMLPARKNRRGFELRCEVVMCTYLSKCQPGHGP